MTPPLPVVNLAPVTWESVLLQCVSLLTSSYQFAASMMERADAALGFLLRFDVFARRLDMTTVLEKEVRAPQMAQSRALRGWTVTFYPSTGTQTNKTWQRDHTVPVGSTSTTCACLLDLLVLREKSVRQKSAAPFLRVSKWKYNALFRSSRLAACVPAATPHQLRHGGASVDFAAQMPPTVLLEQ